MADKEPVAPMGSEIMKGLKKETPPPAPREMTDADYEEWARKIANPHFPAMTISVVVCRRAFLAIGGGMTDEIAVLNQDGMQREIRKVLYPDPADPPSLAKTEDEDPPADDEE